MAYNWSISTTLRTPDRMIAWLKVANKFLVAKEWNNDSQIYYQTLLIQYKLFKPRHLLACEKAKFENLRAVISYEEAKKIFARQKYLDPALRGRTSFSTLKKFGLMKVVNNIIFSTSLTDYLLSENYDFGYFLFRVFLKWEYANPVEKRNYNFNVNPFIATLHLINEVNRIADAKDETVKGISKDEFMIFAQTLIDYNNINDYAKELYRYRRDVEAINRDTNLLLQEREDKKRKKKISILKSLTGEADQNKLEKLLSNLKDYADNTIRYFRATRYIYIRGGGYYIDLEPRRQIEIDVLLNTYNGSSGMFDNETDYMDYLSNISLPVLPWEKKEELDKIFDNLVKDLLCVERELNVHFPVKDLKVDNIDTLRKNIQVLRDKIKEYYTLRTYNSLKDIPKIEECISSLENIRKLRNKPSIELEKWTSMALYALNDALKIHPNYPVGDDNEPLFTAPAGKADIECFYISFNSICEVTMLTSRDQWYNEGQPVMRHLRAFEKAYDDNDAYCLFIAPRLHQDTVNTFWNAVKYGFEGDRQKIIPLTITQFLELLRFLIDLKRDSKGLSHTDIQNLYNKILLQTDSANSSIDWIRAIPNIISDWKLEFTS